MIQGRLTHFLVICLSVTSFCRMVLFFSQVLHRGNKQSVCCAAVIAFPTAILASTEMVMTIHQGNTVLCAGNGCTTIKREYHGFVGRRTRRTEWEIQVCPFQESDRFWFLYPSVFDKSLPTGVKSVILEPAHHCCFTKLFILFL